MELWKLRFSGAGVEALEEGIYVVARGIAEALSIVSSKLVELGFDSEKIEIEHAERLSTNVLGVPDFMMPS